MNCQVSNKFLKVLAGRHSHGWLTLIDDDKLTFLLSILCDVETVTNTQLIPCCILEASIKFSSILSAVAYDIIKIKRDVDMITIVKLVIIRLLTFFVHKERFVVLTGLYAHSFALKSLFT